VITKLILNQKKWIEDLSLKYHWECTYSPIICLSLALSTLSDQVEIGYFIGKQQIVINTHPSLRKDLMLMGKVKIKKHINNMDYLVCQSEVIENENILVEMSSTLIKMNEKLDKKIEETQNSGEFITTITKDQVHKFSELGGDPNNIHKGNNPVVQGMFLLLLIEDYLATKDRFIKRGKIIYFSPIEADCKLFFSFESTNKLSGIVNNIKCFTITIEEEFIC
jgi:hypothetical protein